CRQTLADAQLSTKEIEEVVLVGGMTRMPKIQAAVASFFGRDPCKGVHPDEVVALGAAIQGSALVDEKKQMILLDVTPHAHGIVSVGAKDLETGQEQSIQVTATSGLTQDEIRKMMEDAQQFTVERRSSEEFEGVKQKAEKLITQIEQLLPNVEQVVASSD